MRKGSIIAIRNVTTTVETVGLKATVAKSCQFFSAMLACDTHSSTQVQEKSKTHRKTPALQELGHHDALSPAFGADMGI